MLFFLFVVMVVVVLTIATVILEGGNVEKLCEMVESINVTVRFVECTLPRLSTNNGAMIQLFWY